MGEGGQACHPDARPLRLFIGLSPTRRLDRDSEEAAVGLTRVVPFLVEDRLVELGGRDEKADDWTPFVIVDGLLITGQNPASSVGVADALLEAL